MTYTDFDLELPGVRLRLRSHGDPEVLPVICLPGLTANLTSFDALAAELQRDGRRVLALDLRGRGLSEATAPGSYGWTAHAGDVLAAADAIGAHRFDLVGWSMGGHVSMQVARFAADRVRRLVLLDIAGPVADPMAIAAILRGSERLGTVYGSLEEYLSLVRSLGTVVPWSDNWIRYFEYELAPVEGGFQARTSREAALEDLAYALEHDARDNWPSLTMPVLLVRAARPVLPVGGFLVPEELRDQFRREILHAAVVEVQANHYGIAFDRDALAAIRGFLKPGKA